MWEEFEKNKQVELKPNNLLQSKTLKVKLRFGEERTRERERERETERQSGGEMKRERA